MAYKIISWNCQGVANETTIAAINSLIDKNNLSMIVILEPKISGIDADRAIRKIGMKYSHRVEAVGFSGGIWILWNDSITVKIVLNDWQFIVYKVLFPNNLTVFFTSVYGSPQPCIRRQLWGKLEEISEEMQEPWLVFGDFNAFLEEADKVGGRKSPGCKWFREWVQRTEMRDLGFTGSRFTWARRQCHERLDWALVNEEWVEAFRSTTVEHLPRVASDHSPILIKIEENRPKAKNFRYLGAWEAHIDWHRWLKENWRLDVSLPAAQNMLEERIDDWKYNYFGDLTKRKNRTLARLAGIQKALAYNYSTRFQKLEQQLREEYERTITQEELLKAQNARAIWLAQGDKNSKIFHAVHREKKYRYRKRVKTLRLGDGSWCTEVDKLSEEATNFFRSTYSEEVDHQTGYHIRGRFPRLTEESMTLLSCRVQRDEVKKALFDMAPFKAAGPDGFNPRFYQYNWDTVGDTVCRMVNEVFETGEVKPEINQALITLIPKINQPQSFQQFRPISLINVNVKIVSKVIANRLKKVMSTLTLPTQSSFVPGRNIVDNIVITQEAIHSMRIAKGKKGWMAIKIDLAKAYDRVSWHVIKDTLEDAGIPTLLNRVILSTLESGSTRVLWDGRVGDAFKPSRGVRQGDPVSPYVFVLCMERFAQAISLEVQQGRWKPMVFRRGGESLSHLFFADDLILFAEASIEQAAIIRQTVESFCSSSGQTISEDKSVVYVSPNIDGGLASSISQSLGVKLVNDLGRYLGVPIIHKRVTKSTYREVVTKVQNRVAKWNPEKISLAGRLTLNQAVLTAMPNHFMQSTTLPVGICDEIDRLRRRFLWGGDIIVQSPSKSSPAASLIAYCNKV